MTSSCDIFIFAGEPSGDLHGEAVIHELKKKQKKIKISAVAGPRMRNQAIECVMKMEEFQVMGFIDVVLALPKIMRNFYFLAGMILKLKPKAALFIDYPGFNLRMEKYLRKKGFQGKLLHYICPSVWSHGKGRIELMEKTIDELFCILPFEPECFPSKQIPVTYVGNPLISRIQEYIYRPLDDLKEKKVIAFFPGSRSKEIERNLDMYVQLIKMWMQEYKDLYFAISVSRDLLKPMIEKILKAHNLESCGKISLVPPLRTYDLMKIAYGAIAKSGTVILELALHKVPTIVTYGARWIDIFIAQKILKVDMPHYSLPNILAKKEIYPELIGPSFTMPNLRNASTLLFDQKFRKDVIKGCQEVTVILGTKKASVELAQKLEKYL